jgi:hypothetical protein
MLTLRPMTSKKMPHMPKEKSPVAVESWKAKEPGREHRTVMKARLKIQASSRNLRW